MVASKRASKICLRKPIPPLAQKINDLAMQIYQEVLSQKPDETQL